MSNNEFMYAVERSDEYLAHYGVRGMKWGVRKALAKGGVAGARALSKQYAKAQKKLAKLEKQAGKSKKYARRAALMGVGAAAAGGLAARGTKVVSDTLGGVNERRISGCSEIPCSQGSWRQVHQTDRCYAAFGQCSPEGHFQGRFHDHIPWQDRRRC